MLLGELSGIVHGAEFAENKGMSQYADKKNSLEMQFNILTC